MTNIEANNSFLLKIGGMGITPNMTIHQKRSILLNNLLSQNDGIAYIVFGLIFHIFLGWNIAVGVSYFLGALKFSTLLLSKFHFHFSAKLISVFFISLIGGPILFAGCNGIHETIIVNIYFITMMVYAILSFDWTIKTEKLASILACVFCLLWTQFFHLFDEIITFLDVPLDLDHTVVVSIFPIFSCVITFLAYTFLQNINIKSTQELQKTVQKMEIQGALQQAVFDSAAAIIISIDTNGLITSANKTTEQLLHYQASELIGKVTLDQLYDQDEMLQRIDAISDTVGEKVVPGFELLIAQTKQCLQHEDEWCLVRKDGTKFLAKVVNTIIRDNQGVTIGYTSLATDISSWKENEANLHAKNEELLASEEELRQNIEELQTTQDLLKEQEKGTQKLKERFELAIKGSNDGIWDWNLITNEVYYSDRWKTMLGYEVDEIKNSMDAFSKLLHPDDQKTIAKIFHSYVLNERTDHQAEFRLKQKDGTYRWLLTRGALVLDDKGKPYRVAGSNADIQVKKEQEKFIKIKNEELLASEEELKQNAKELEQAFLSEQKSKAALEQTLQQLTATQAQLIQSEKLSSLGQLTAGVAHEINNPINFVFAGAHTLKDVLSDLYTIIQQYASINTKAEPEELAHAFAEIEALKEDVAFNEMEEDIKGLLQDILLGAERTQTIVQSLKIFSRMGTESFKKADFDKNITATLTILNSQLGKRIRVIKEVEPNLPLVDCYIDQVNQVVMNLLSNAIQAIENEGEIYIKLWSDTEEKRVYVQIKDSGKGMDSETMSKIFDPFFTTKDIGEGTGLGLSIVHGILEKHDSQITLESAPGKGTTFTLAFWIDQDTNFLQKE